jgi:hypothetical protein
MVCLGAALRKQRKAKGLVRGFSERSERIILWLSREPEGVHGSSWVGWRERMSRGPRGLRLAASMAAMGDGPLQAYPRREAQDLGLLIRNV